MPRVEQEVVTYNKPAMIHTSREFIRAIAQNHVDPDSVTESDKFIARITSSIESDATRVELWRTPGLHISFSGFNALSTIEDKGIVYYRALPPYFTLREPLEPIRPRMRTYLNEFTNAIVQEMNDVYKLDPRKKDNATLLYFPKNRYATQINWVRATFLGS